MIGCQQSCDHFEHFDSLIVGRIAHHWHCLPTGDATTPSGTLMQREAGWLLLIDNALLDEWL